MTDSDLDEIIRQITAMSARREATEQDWITAVLEVTGYSGPRILEEALDTSDLNALFAELKRQTAEGK